MSKDKDTPKHGYASFSKDDTEDAKRGEPARTLDAYAASRGLTSLGQVKLTAYRGILPAWPEYIFNVVSGVLPGGATGVLEHELQEVPTDTSRGILWGGTFYDTHYTAKGGKGFLSKILPFELSVDEPKAAFEASALWVPVTAAVVRVPEAALLPYMVVRPKDFLPMGDPTLDDVGAPGFRILGKQLPPELRASVFGGPVGEVLRTFAHPYVELMASHGGVALRRNGFVHDDDRLDDLAQAASTVARGLADAAASLHRPQPFSAELPPPGDGAPTDLPWYPWPTSEWREGFAKVAGELSLTQEDPTALHRAFPKLPVPGIAQGVLRGVLPGAGVDGRLVFLSPGRGSSADVRGAVLIAAPSSAPEFAPGGTLVTETDMYVEVADGIAAMWNRVVAQRRLDAQSLVERAVATARQVGLLA